MANLCRVRAEWSGSSVVGPGVSTFYFNEAASGFIADLTTFFQALQNFIPLTTQIRVLSSGDLIDVATGALSGTWSDGVNGTANGAGTGTYAQGVGARIRWATGGITNGRRVRGSTYIVPIISTQFDGSSGLQTSLVTNITNAANALLTAQLGDLTVYTRPAPSHPGAAHPVTSADVPDKVSWLRTRRT